MIWDFLTIFLNFYLFIFFVYLVWFNTNSKCHFSKKTNPKITILEILVYKAQPEIIKYRNFTRFNFVTKPCLQEQVVMFAGRNALELEADTFTIKISPQKF